MFSNNFIFMVTAVPKPTTTTAVTTKRHLDCGPETNRISRQM